MAQTPEITQMLVAWSNGDQDALKKLVPLVSQELHRLAKRYMGKEDPNHTLQATALVNEAYLRLIHTSEVKWQNRAQFFAISAQIMRHILVDFARSQGRVKRGGDALHVTLDEELVAAGSLDANLVAVDEALKKLAELNPRQSRVVELRFFGGLDLEETAEVLDVSVRTVKRDWTFARAWLHRELSRADSGA